MDNEKYIFTIGKKGSEGLGKLDYLFNSTTQDFILQSGLQPGMKVLDIGCGSGVMSCWLAEQVGLQGKVVAIENNENQLNAAQKRANGLSLSHIHFKLCSAYDIATLNEKFDLIYCRFVLHHLHQPMKVMEAIFKLLERGGVYVAEEGIINFAFSYPFSPAWGDEATKVPPVWVDVEADQRDGNIGVKMVTKMLSIGFHIISAKIIHPLLITKLEKQCLLLGRDEMKPYFLSQGHTEEEWTKLDAATEALVNHDEQIAGFYASCQAAGQK